MSLINIAGLAPDNTGRRIRCNQFGDLLAATADFFPNGSVLLGSAQATALQADSAPAATYDTANKRPGWYYINDAATNKINWYYYADTADNNNRTYAQLTGLTCTMAIDGQYPPYFAVYTKGTEHVWYGKKVVYQNQDADLNLFAGQKCLMYFAATANDYPRNPNQLREINCPILTAASDTPAPTDEILFITLQSDSVWDPDSFAGVVSQVGFRFVDNIVEYELRADASTGTGSDVNITNTFINTHATPYVGGDPVDGTNPLNVIFEGQGLLAREATLIEVRNEIAAGVDTQSTIYYNGVPVDSGTNAFPVVIAGSSSVEISATNGDPLTATGTALDVTNPSLAAMTFDKGTDLNVCVVSQPLPISTYGAFSVPAAVCQIVDSTNTAFTNTVAGALDVAVVNFSLTTENNLSVQLQTATGPIGDGNPLIVQNEPPALTSKAWTLANFSDGGNPNSVSPTIVAGSLSVITIFGSDTNSTGMSSPYLVYQYCLTDSATPSDWIDTLPYISLPNGGTFYDSRAPVVPFLRLKIVGFIAPPGPVVDTLVLNVCYK
jgi:hypothetical protein